MAAGGGVVWCGVVLVRLNELRLSKGLDEMTDGGPVRTLDGGNEIGWRLGR